MTCKQLRHLFSEFNKPSIWKTKRRWECIRRCRPSTSSGQRRSSISAACICGDSKNSFRHLVVRRVTLQRNQSNARRHENRSHSGRRDHPELLFSVILEQRSPSPTLIDALNEAKAGIDQPPHPPNSEEESRRHLAETALERRPAQKLTSSSST